jgi:hypothetical protein
MDIDKELSLFLHDNRFEDFYLIRIRKETVLLWCVYIVGILVGITLGRNKSWPAP